MFRFIGKLIVLYFVINWAIDHNVIGNVVNFFTQETIRIKVVDKKFYNKMNEENEQWIISNSEKFKNQTSFAFQKNDLKADVFQKYMEIGKEYTVVVSGFHIPGIMYRNIVKVPGIMDNISEIDRFFLEKAARDSNRPLDITEYAKSQGDRSPGMDKDLVEKFQSIK